MVFNNKRMHRTVLMNNIFGYDPLMIMQVIGGFVLFIEINEWVHRWNKKLICLCINFFC